MMRWGDKPYHSLDWEMRQRFGEKVYRLSLDAGLTCPNRDGTLGSRGCIFCSDGGSGEFSGVSAGFTHAAHTTAPIPEQLAAQKELIRKKGSCRKFIAYFQSYTNTYAPVSRLRRIFTEALSDPEVVMLSVATRPDCLPDEVIRLLQELNRDKPVCVELGLQTIHEQTAAMIRRGYALPCFDDAVRRLREAGLEVIVHVILGLPGETRQMMLQTVRYLNTAGINGVKLQLLHVLSGTDLAAMYGTEPFHIFEMDEYIDLVIDCIECLSGEIVIHRLTGDGASWLLIAPQWSLHKRLVLNTLHRRLKERGTWQGRLA